MYLREAGLTGTSEAIAVPKGSAATVIAQLTLAGFNGVAVTTPLKEEVASLCVALDPKAAAVRGVSAIYLGARGALGNNFDGVAAAIALQTSLGAPLDGRTIVVLGAGPTASAATAELVAAGARVLVWSRTQQRAVDIAQRLEATLWGDETPDAIFAALPPDAALPEVLRKRISACRAIVDANYGSRATLAATVEAPVTDGREMLAIGARAAFDWWLARDAVRLRET